MRRERRERRERRGGKDHPGSLVKPSSVILISSNVSGGNRRSRSTRCSLRPPRSLPPSSKRTAAAGETSTKDAALRSTGLMTRFLSSLFVSRQSTRSLVSLSCSVLLVTVRQNKEASYSTGSPPLPLHHGGLSPRWKMIVPIVSQRIPLHGRTMDSAG